MKAGARGEAGRSPGTRAGRIFSDSRDRGSPVCCKLPVWLGEGSGGPCGDSWMQKGASYMEGHWFKLEGTLRRDFPSLFLGGSTTKGLMSPGTLWHPLRIIRLGSGGRIRGAATGSLTHYCMADGAPLCTGCRDGLWLPTPGLSWLVFWVGTGAGLILCHLTVWSCSQPASHCS